MDELEVKPDERLRCCPFCGSKVAPYVTRYRDRMRELAEKEGLR